VNILPTRPREPRRLWMSRGCRRRCWHSPYGAAARHARNNAQARHRAALACGNSAGRGRRLPEPRLATPPGETYWTRKTISPSRWACGQASPARRFISSWISLDVTALTATSQHGRVNRLPSGGAARARRASPALGGRKALGVSCSSSRSGPSSRASQGRGRATTCTTHCQ